jgi:hypothetical protein
MSTKIRSDEILVMRARVAAGCSWDGEDGGHGNKTESQEPEVRRILRECADRIDQLSSWEDTPDEWTQAIDAAFPTRSGSHDEYGMAIQMVSHRHSKGELVKLVNWLLIRLNAQAKEIAEHRTDRPNPHAEALRRAFRGALLPSELALIEADGFDEAARISFEAAESLQRKGLAICHDVSDTECWWTLTDLGLAVHQALTPPASK